jgi:hypothetical protein
MNLNALRPVLAHCRIASVLAVLGALTTGCGGDKTDSSDDGGGTELPGGSDGTAECGGTPPVITEVQCSADGLKEFEQGSELPTLLLSIFVADEDADLNAMEVSIYLDDEVDGTVSTQDPEYAPIVVSLSQETCNEPDATVNISTFINGVSPRFNQTYEWGVVVRDANDDASAIYIFECITPFENGDAGTGEG